MARITRFDPLMVPVGIDQAIRSMVANVIADTAAAATEARNVSGQVGDQLAGLSLPPWVVTAILPDSVEVMALSENAYEQTSATLPHSGVTLPTMEFLL